MGERAYFTATHRSTIRCLQDSAAFPGHPSLAALASTLGRDRRGGGASKPGDNLVPDCQYVITRAISIDRPPSAVWPWLLQIGFVLNEFGDFAMMRKMLLTIKKNVEADHRGVAA